MEYVDERPVKDRDRIGLVPWVVRPAASRSRKGGHQIMSTQPVEDLDATVTDGGDVVVPAEQVSRVVDVKPGDHVRVRILGKEHSRRNMYGVFADDPIGLADGDLAEVRQEMWRDFGSGDGA
jgi:hypothetical protein